MFEIYRLNEPVEISGIGVHFGEKSKILLIPEEGDNLFFYNKKRDCTIEFNHKFIKNFNSTSLIKNDCKIYTIEHLMATLYILQIRGIKIEVYSEELPILDGSGVIFYEKILKSSVNTKILSKSIEIKNKFEIKDKNGFAIITPSDRFIVDYTIEFNHPSIMIQNLILEINKKNFKKEIAPARTFGFLKDAEYLKKKGLALGASYENTIVLDESKIINPPLRFDDEFVRHKILDLIGDLSFLKLPVKGYFKIYKGGHYLHRKIVDKILNTPIFN